MSVTGVVMISSPGSRSSAATAECSAPEPESVAKAYLMLCFCANLSSNASTLSPAFHRTIAFRTTSVTCRRSSSPKKCLEPKGLVRTGVPPSMARVSMVMSLPPSCQMLAR